MTAETAPVVVPSAETGDEDWARLCSPLTSRVLVLALPSRLDIVSPPCV
ncbi:hypothetical protein PV726_32050 [Streptomyces europaeiscabiei]|nr:hypothetical protein [Streptomyces europaeiscabiei]MDX3694889.1 hypothetical protein [Streptomyces europaeiscabiei]